MAVRVLLDEKQLEEARQRAEAADAQRRARLALWAQRREEMSRRVADDGEPVMPWRECMAHGLRQRSSQPA
ncbi:MAG TPA: hypothetical protein VE991_08585 [Acidimicrobiales bacterium]|nr:hypothetical protein [Acidimicrobiales bacterium]